VHAIVIDPHRDVFVACDTRVTMIDAHGRDRWTFTLTGAGWVNGVALAPDGGVYVYGPPPSFDASILVALTPTGAVRWRGTIDKLAGIRYRHGASDAGVAISAATVAANGTLYIGTTDHLAALSPTGRRLWQRYTTPSDATEANEIDQILVGKNGTLYVAGSNTFGGPAFIEAFDPGGHPLWTWTVGNPVAANYLDAMVLGPDGTIYAQAHGKIFHFRPL
jgi:PQQ-like domain